MKLEVKTSATDLFQGERGAPITSKRKSFSVQQGKPRNGSNRSTSSRAGTLWNGDLLFCRFMSSYPCSRMSSYTAIRRDKIGVSIYLTEKRLSSGVRRLLRR